PGAAKAARVRRHHEGQAERQEDLREVPSDPPPRPDHGHLLGPAPQAAPGLTASAPVFPAHAFRRRPVPVPAVRGYNPRSEAGASSKGRREGNGTGKTSAQHEGASPTWHAFPASTSRATSAWRSLSPTFSGSAAPARTDRKSTRLNSSH